MARIWSSISPQPLVTSCSSPGSIRPKARCVNFSSVPPDCSTSRYWMCEFAGYEALRGKWDSHAVMSMGSRAGRAADGVDFGWPRRRQGGDGARMPGIVEALQSAPLRPKAQRPKEGACYWFICLSRSRISGRGDLPSRSLRLCVRICFLGRQCSGFVGDDGEDGGELGDF